MQSKNYNSTRWKNPCKGQEVKENIGVLKLLMVGSFILAGTTQLMAVVPIVQYFEMKYII